MFLSKGLTLETFHGLCKDKCQTLIILAKCFTFLSFTLHSDQGILYGALCGMTHINLTHSRLCFTTILQLSETEHF
jgi:hypothetical protein